VWDKYRADQFITPAAVVVLATKAPVRNLLVVLVEAE
jgi:hypothetical protein